MLRIFGVLLAGLAIGGCATAGQGLSDLITTASIASGATESSNSPAQTSSASVASTSGHETGKTNQRSRIRALTAAKVHSVAASGGGSQWPQNCQVKRWPQPSFSGGPSGRDAARFVAGIFGAGRVFDATEKFVQTVSDPEMMVQDTTKKAYIFHALGGTQHRLNPLSFYRFGDFERARATAQNVAQNARSRFGDRSPQFGVALTVLAQVHQDSDLTSDNVLAKRYWRQAIEIFAANRQPGLEVDALIALGQLLASEGRTAAVEAISDRLNSKQTTRDQASRALLLRARLDVMEGQPTAAVRKIDTALAYWAPRAKESSTAQAAGQRIAREFFFAMLNTVEEEQPMQLVPQLEEAQVFGVAAGLYMDLGRDAEAAKLMDAALRSARNTIAHYRPERIRLFVRAAEIYRRVGRTDDARKALTSVRNMQRWNLTFWTRDVADRHLELGEIALQRGNNSAAERNLRIALAWWQSELGATDRALRPLIGLANLYLKSGKPSTALVYARPAACFADQIARIGTARGTTRARILREAYITYARARMAMDQSGAVLEDVHLAVHAARRGLASGAIDRSLSAHGARKGVRALLRKRRAISERLADTRRAQAANLLVSSGLAQEVENAKQAEAAKDRDAKRVYASRQYAPTIPQYAAVGVRPEDLVRQRNEIDRALKRALGRASTSVFDRGPSLREVQKSLGARDGFVELAVGETATILIAVDRQSVTLSTLPHGERDLRLTVDGFRRDLTGGRTGRSFDATNARRLGTAIFGALDQFLANKATIFIASDGILSEVPFGALKRGDRWLLDDVAVALVPSARSLVLLAGQRRRPAPKPFLGVGDPLLQAAAPTGGRVNQILGVRGGSSRVADLKRLPETATELRAVATAYGAGSQSVLLGDAATEKRLLSKRLSDYRVIAFATHALMPGETIDNEDAAIVLSRGATRDDGLLTAREISRLNLNADLIILSACNTAAGNDRLGSERLSGLARSFFMAGARSVLASHWYVESEATRQLITSFARRTKAGDSNPKALRAAALAMKSDPRYAHPYYWSAFDLVGR